MDSEKFFKYASGSYVPTIPSPELRPALQKRILTDLKEIRKDSLLNIKVDTSDDSIYMWKVKFDAPNGKAIHATLHFNSQYPFEPPIMFIKQRLFHPNVSPRGEVCFQNLKKIWTPAHFVWSLILSVQCLLSDPNPNDPVNLLAGKMLLETPEAYHKHAAHWFETLDLFSDACAKVEPNDFEANYITNGKNNSFEKVESEEFLGLQYETNENDEDKIKNKNDDELNHDEIFQLEQEMLLQHILQN